jgi:hypothetical protein
MAIKVKNASSLRLILHSLFMIHLCSACVASPTLTPTQTQLAPTSTPILLPTVVEVPTLSPTGTPPPEVSPGTLYQDDFSDPKSGWQRYRGSDGVMDYEDGSYRIFVNVDLDTFRVNAGLNLDDVQIEVDATKIDGPDANAFGVMCRFDADTLDHYFFTIGSDGTIAIGKVIGGNREFLAAFDTSMNPVFVNLGAATNHIRADCVGTTLRLHINERMFVEREDTDLQRGDVGLIVGTLGGPGADILFDNLVIYKP